MANGTPPGKDKRAARQSRRKCSQIKIPDWHAILCPDSNRRFRAQQFEKGFLGLRPVFQRAAALRSFLPLRAIRLLQPSWMQEPRWQGRKAREVAFEKKSPAPTPFQSTE